MNTAISTRFGDGKMKMRSFERFMELVRPHEKYFQALVTMFWISLWFIAFTYTVYEMATKGIW